MKTGEYPDSSTTMELSCLRAVIGNTPDSTFFCSPFFRYVIAVFSSRHVPSRANPFSIRLRRLEALFCQFPSEPSERIGQTATQPFGGLMVRRSLPKNGSPTESNTGPSLLFRMNTG